MWVVLHSGSRGIGNQLAQIHIAGRDGPDEALVHRARDPDLAYLVEGTPEFEAYIADHALGPGLRARQPRGDDGRRPARGRRCSSTAPCDRGPARSTATTTSPQREHHHGRDAVDHPQGRHPGERRRPRRHPRLDGDPVVHRRGHRVTRRRTARARTAPAAGSRGQAAANKTLDASLREAMMAGKAWNDADAERTRRRGPLGLQGHRPGDGRPAGPRRTVHHRCPRSSTTRASEPLWQPRGTSPDQHNAA